MIAIGDGVAQYYISSYSICIDIICPNIEKIIEAIDYTKPSEIYVSKYYIIIKIIHTHFRFILKHYNSLIDAFDDLSLGTQMIAFDGENMGIGRRYRYTDCRYACQPHPEQTQFIVARRLGY